MSPQLTFCQLILLSMIICQTNKETVMLKENGMEKPAGKKETSSAVTKKVVCIHCENNFDAGTSTTFGEEVTCPRCGQDSAN